MTICEELSSNFTGPIFPNFKSFDSTSEVCQYTLTRGNIPQFTLKVFAIHGCELNTNFFFPYLKLNEGVNAREKYSKICWFNKFGRKGNWKSNCNFCVK